MDKDKATTILSACYSYAKNDIGILIKRCLLKFNDKNELRMHDLLQDLGREIARNKFPGEPQKYSRLWHCVDICNVLKKDKGTESIEGIVPYDGKLNQVTLNTKTFERMHRLRLLDISNVHLTGSFEHIFEELRWLCWCNCSLKCLPSDFHSEKLVILDLRYSNIKILCNGNLFLEQLKILDLTGCKFLKITTDISGLASLEKLFRSGCTCLVEVHPSIECLGKLVCLDLSYYKKLTILTSRVCNLRALEYLYVNGCSNLEGLPKELGNIESIRVLRAGYNPIKKLPDSIGLLRNLFELNLSDCWDLINLPSSIGQLRGLERLILDRCLALESLPDSIGQLSKLVELNLCDCVDLRDLPSSICNLRALKRLNLNGCSSLERLPQDLGNIESLEFLSAKNTMIIELPDLIGRLTKLLELYLCNCWNLRNLPSSICNLRALEKLNIDGCSNLEGLPEELGKMESLRELRGGNINLIKIPDSIGDMKNLRVLNLRSSCRPHMNLDLVLHPPFTRFVPPSIAGLCSLNSLDLSNCDLFDEDIPDNIGSLSSLETLNLSGNYFSSLPSSLVQLSNLRRLYLKRCKRLRSLPGIPPNLCVLHARDCISLERLPNLSTLEEGRKRKWKSEVATF